MAKHPKRRRKFRRYLRGKINIDVDVGTLAANTLAAQVLGDTVKDRSWVSSVRASYSLGIVTPTSGVGPLIVGWAHSDYTAAEIEEWLETTGSWDEGDKVQQEIARRKIKTVGTFQSPGSAILDTVLNDGKELTTKLGWMLNQGQTLDLWIYNSGEAAYVTTDPDMRVVGHANIWPSG